MAKKVIMIISFRDFRDPEYFIPKGILEKADFDVKTASNKKGLAIGAEGGDTEVDFLVSDVNVSDFDAVVFVGGPGCIAVLDNENSYKLLKKAASEDKIIAAICISPVILANAGILKGKKATVWMSEMNKKAISILQEKGCDYQKESVVSDGKIITADGPSSAEEFGKTIVKLLTISG